MNAMDVALICKALGDANRLEIVQMLSDGEKCGCKLLERFEITQPTLSHHINLLVKAGLVTTEKSGTWHYYDLNKNAFEKFKTDTAELTADTPACICEPVRSKAVCAIEKRADQVTQK